MEEKKTPCECPLAGFCNRHGINKTEHFHKLCSHHPGYFKMWEECRGPGQSFTDCTQTKSEEEVAASREVAEIKPEPNPAQLPQACPYCGQGPCNGQCRNKQQLPSTMQMAKNLAVSAKDHAKSGFQTSSEEEIARRLEICAECPYYKPETAQCVKCGCFTKFKAKLKSGKCPDGRW